MQGQGKGKANYGGSSANLGFEAKWWLAADKLRNNMDTAGYKHVVRGRGGVSAANGASAASNIPRRVFLMPDVTRILPQIESGDPAAAEQLLPLMYAELRELAAADPEAADLVQLCCFAGLTLADAAQLVTIPRRSADRRWAYARARLHRELLGPQDGEKQDSAKIPGAKRHGTAHGPPPIG